MENIRIEYFREQIEKGVRDILEAQKMIATERVYMSGHERKMTYRPGETLRRGSLLEALRNPQYRTAKVGDGISTMVVIPKCLRFLDMKEHGNWMIYNRQVWGILYSETIHNVRYEYRQWLADRFPEMLRMAGFGDKI